MRSNPFLALLALLLVASTGCCVNRMACDGGYYQSGCGCDSNCQDSSCGGRCSTGLQGRLSGGLLNRGCGCSDCGAADNCGNGWTGPLGVVSITRSNTCDQGACVEGGAVAGSGGLLGGGLFARDYCATDDCGNGVALAGGMGDRRGAMGCGRFGCGRNGQQCLGCRMRGGRGPYGGEIPHTDPNAYGYGGGESAGFGGGPVNYAYPYYTTRGPRDFLMNNPPSIGW